MLSTLWAFYSGGMPRPGRNSVDLGGRSVLGGREMGWSNISSVHAAADTNLLTGDCVLSPDEGAGRQCQRNGGNRIETGAGLFVRRPLGFRFCDLFR
jgi:hypothetical protein